MNKQPNKQNKIRYKPYPPLRRYMAEILPIRRKTLYNQSINQSYPPSIKKHTLENLFKVFHSSAFQTISRRSVYIKIIDYSDSLSANLNNTIQTKQPAMKKPHSYSNRNKIYKGLFFVVEGF